MLLSAEATVMRFAQWTLTGNWIGEGVDGEEEAEQRQSFSGHDTSESNLWNTPSVHTVP